MRRLAVVGLALTVAACGSKSPTQPSPQPTPQPTIVSLLGIVSSSGTGIAGATVRITDGANAGKTVTTGTSGNYRFDGLTPSNANVFASAPCFLESGGGVFINGTNTLNIALERGPVYRASGSGNTVFDMPTCFSRVRIQAHWNGSGNSNFIVYIAGRLVVNEVLRGVPGQNFDGTYLTSGGVVQIVDSTFCTWTFTEAR